MSMIKHGRSAWLRTTTIPVLAVAFLWSAVAMGAEQAQRLFDTPEAAFNALVDALAHQDDAQVLAILGSKYENQIYGRDRAVAHEEQARFVARARQAVELRPDGENRRIAYVGPRAWPLPIPIVRDGAQWRFDTEAGVDEIANRRIGGNELRTITVMRAYVDAQVAYASEDHDGDQVLEYAQRLRSSPGKHDGLYWPSEEGDQDQSPIGPMLAAAVESHNPGDSYNGYYYRILTRQGSSAPGGAYDYVINGHMIAGFALVAWPADYGYSGVMTFIVSHQGKVYEKDLGEKTADVAAAITAYDPDSSWSEVQE